MHELVLNDAHWSDTGEPVDNCDCEEPLIRARIDYRSIASPGLVRNIASADGDVPPFNPHGQYGSPPRRSDRSSEKERRRTRAISGAERYNDDTYADGDEPEDDIDDIVGSRTIRLHQVPGLYRPDERELAAMTREQRLRLGLEPIPGFRDRNFV
jgi:hypothetical protein